MSGDDPTIPLSQALAIVHAAATEWQTIAKEGMERAYRLGLSDGLTAVRKVEEVMDRIDAAEIAGEVIS